MLLFDDCGALVLTGFTVGFVAVFMIYSISYEKLSCFNFSADL